MRNINPRINTFRLCSTRINYKYLIWSFPSTFKKPFKTQNDLVVDCDVCLHLPGPHCRNSSIWVGFLHKAMIGALQY